MLKIDPQYEDAYYNLGYIYFQQDSIEEAYKHFNIAVNVEPSYSKGYYMRGLIEESRGKKDIARKDYNRALSLDPEFSLASKGLERLAN